MNRFYNYLDGLFGHLFLHVQPPKTGEVNKSSLEFKCLENAQFSPSSGRIAAQEGVEHGLLQALLVLPTPCNHSPFAVCCVQMVAIRGKRKADNRLI